MKKLLSAMLVSMFMVVGCSSNNSGWQVRGPEVNFFVYQATKIILNESQIDNENLQKTKEYLLASKDLLLVPGDPDFTRVKGLVDSYLPDQYRFVGLSVIDVVERYVENMDESEGENQELVRELVVAAIDGAVRAIDEKLNV